MEDAVTIVQNSPAVIAGDPSLSASLYCVFDGHGGQDCALFADRYLPEFVFKTLGAARPAPDPVAIGRMWADTLHQALKHVSGVTACGDKTRERLPRLRRGSSVSLSRSWTRALAYNL